MAKKTFEQDLSELVESHPVMSGIHEADPLVNMAFSKPKKAKTEIILQVSPDRVRPWKYHNREISSWQKKSPNDTLESMKREGRLGRELENLIESIKSEGQLQAAVARSLTGDPDGYDFELIYGVRRWIACSLLNRTLNIQVVQVTDIDAAKWMHEENTARADLSELEKALSFRKQIPDVFPTQAALGEALRLSQGYISKRISIADLFSIPAINNLFPEKREITFKSAYALVQATQKNERALKSVIEAAERLSSDLPKRSPSELLGLLIESLDSERDLPKVSRGYNLGSTKLRVKRDSKGKVTFTFPSGMGGLDPEDALSVFRQALREL